MSNAPHTWPTDPEAHLWGPWMTQTRTTQYRTCVYPLCNEVETRSAPSA